LLIVPDDVSDFEFVIVFVPVPDTVEVLDDEIEPENEDEADEVFEYLDENVSLRDPDELEE
jgi:hypothetical protein